VNCNDGPWTAQKKSWETFKTKKKVKGENEFNYELTKTVCKKKTVREKLNSWLKFEMNLLFWCISTLFFFCSLMKVTSFLRYFCFFAFGDSEEERKLSTSNFTCQTTKVQKTTIEMFSWLPRCLVSSLSEILYSVCLNYLTHNLSFYHKSSLTHYYLCFKN
jgi:hypothetical protein